ncbi:hypothetical protein [Micromonospora zamorensis]|uniref:hypothetical protein n=1 Tax=Micromonospora zamorensis TaxID=709883 RepID=UPI00340CC8BA
MITYCEHCAGRLPEGSRSHRRFCSDSHRARASEERRRLAGQREYDRLYVFLQENGTPDQIAAWNALTDPHDLENDNA